MDLTKVERKILWNQFEILKSLYPDREQDYTLNQDILENGYQPLYKSMFEMIEDGEISKSQHEFVQDVLSMFESFQRFEQDSGQKLDEVAATFSGFCGNHETKLMGYTQFLVERLGRWDYLKIKYFNSHVPMVPVYERMLAVWEKIAFPQRMTSLTKEQIDEIFAARVHPDARA